jgi:F-type H+-transporting ATPase subunit delta
VKITKQARRDAKHLLKSCMANGALDDGRVRQAVSAVVAAKPRGYLGLLQHFQRLLRLEIARRTARVESAVPMPEALQGSLRASLERRHGAGLHFEFAQNAALIGGLRVQVGSDVYDGSVRARLLALREKLTN